MLRIEGHEPVAGFVEEGEALHLREASEVDVGSLLLHVGHLLHALFHLLHVLLGCIGMQDILQRVFIGIDESLARNLDVAVFQQIGHDFVLNATGISLGLHAKDHLHLQLGQFLAAVLILACQRNDVLHLGIDARFLGIGHQSPAHQGALSHPFVGRLLVDSHQGLELMYVEEVERGQRYAADNELLVNAINRRREQNIHASLSVGGMPEFGSQHIVEQVAK